MYERDSSHYSTNHADKTGTARSLESLLDEKVATLRAPIAGVTADLDNRTHVSNSIRREIEEHYRRVKNKLFALTAWPPTNTHRLIEAQRSQLERQLDLLLHEHREETRNAVQDRARLRAEQRAWVKQYRDLLLRTQLIAGHRKAEHWQ